MIRKLYDNLTLEKVRTLATVLSSSGIHYVVERSDELFELWVTETDLDRSIEVTEQYIAENPDPPTDETKEAPRSPCWMSAAVVSLLLIVCHLMAKRGGHFMRIVDDFGASASRILSGEVYRSFTALLLHADIGHLSGNIVGILLFGSAVCTLASVRAGWLMIVLSGIFGNIANAVFIRSAHLSIGASTAVFGAVGLLSALQFTTKRKTTDQRKRAWLSIAGGIALLGFLGVGAHSDITAHLFGFVAGILIGIAYHMLVAKKPAALH